MGLSKKEFSEYFHAYYRPLCLHALHYLGNTDESEDIVQETFANLWSKQPSGGIQSVKAYLFGAVRNNCLAKIRDAKTTVPLEPGYIDDSLTIEEEQERADMESRIWKMIDELPERRREIFLLAKRDGLRYKEIADLTGLSVKTVESHVARAMQQLRQKDRGAYLFFFA
ncbi:MAG TPA: RNA polymerase sigma-70 factor [Porphyromonadaceae bacterium]|jgi:RNA polymerase sigma-70 factor (ECF subfamily)|nr:RNA polymerase sigma-70 factor [Porphyromonadaceae bacterium]HBX46040.1 RNA polymerase sigma-70 factor [Porphyromonadaceae bacterium]HCM20040.1 RNA polymerase sigma-70 factor [Porphyromonadaceae bacterium]